MTAWKEGLEMAKQPGYDVDDDVVRQVDEVTGALEVLADVLGRGEELQVALRRVSQQALHAVGEADMASITLLRDGRLQTATSTHDHAGEIDRAQYALGQGACVLAAKSGEVERLTLAQLRERWPALADELGDTAVGSYLSAPLFIDSEHHGSLNLYSHDSHGFDALEAALLELYTTAAEAALHHAQLYLRAREQVSHLGRALDSRGVIDQAKGILMAVHRIDADGAFAKLVEQSQQQNRKLHDVAQHFVATATGKEA